MWLLSQAGMPDTQGKVYPKQLERIRVRKKEVIRRQVGRKLLGASVLAIAGTSSAKTIASPLENICHVSTAY